MSLFCSLRRVSAPSEAPGGHGPLRLDSAGVFFVGGREIPIGGCGRGSAGTTQITEQSAVHHLAPSLPRDVSVVFYPGLGLTSYIYLATPDRRDGWASMFAREGFPAYVFDPPEHRRFKL